jgi:Antitoxin of toxin-antitoxin stability system
MITVNQTQLRDNLEELCDRAINGETIVVSCPNNKNVVIMSEKEYNAMQAAARSIAQYTNTNENE